MVSNKFVERVISERIVDTRRYRYIIREHLSNGYAEILRIHLDCLGTTNSINDWEVVKIL